MQKTIQKIYKENSLILLFVLTVWLSCVIAGILCAVAVSGNTYTEIHTLTDTAVSTSSGFSFMLKNGLMTNLKYMVCITVSASFILLMPILAALIGFKGFSVGFTTAFLIRAYGTKGIGIVAGTVLFPLSLSLPVYFAIFIISLRYQAAKFKSRKRLSYDEKKKDWCSYAAAMAVALLLLCFITLLEAGISTLIYKMVLK